MNSTLVSILLPAALTLFIAGAAWVFVHLGTWLKARSTNSRLFGVLATLNDFIAAVVADIEANEKKRLLEASPEKVLTVEMGLELKKIAVDRIKAADWGGLLSKLSSAALSAPSVDTYISGKVEQAVARLPSPK